ncbi:MAG: FG-GAP repeat domain-containing protein, partial [Candidatus Saccharimonadales bacterium]
DYNNDGWPDIYVTGFGRNFLFRNRGDGTFEEVAEQAGVQNGRWGMGAAWGDVNRDGHLDLYVANYLSYPLDRVDPLKTSCHLFGLPVYCGPRGFPGQQDRLYIADGRGCFRDISKQQNIDSSRLYSLTATMTDYDNDGWPDIVVCTDLAQNLLYHNTGGKTFEEVAIISGVGYSQDGVEEGTMGIAVGDINNDGWLDLYLSNSSFQPDELLENNHDGTFTNITDTSGQRDATYLSVKWGVAFADFDNDGWQDMFVDCGGLYPQADQFNLGRGYLQRPLVFMNNRNNTFRDTGSRFGLSQKWKSRGLAIGDYDNDGKLDVLINNIDDAPVLLHNEMADTGH